MVRTTICCDVCGRPLPVEQVITPFGVFESVKTFKCKEWDISCLFPDVCELCAMKIDNAISQIRTQFKEDL
jgi:hypothetical protein